MVKAFNRGGFQVIGASITKITVWRIFAIFFTCGSPGRQNFQRGRPTRLSRAEMTQATKLTITADQRLLPRRYKLKTSIISTSALKVGENIKNRDVRPILNDEVLVLRWKTM